LGWVQTVVAVAQPQTSTIARPNEQNASARPDEQNAGARAARLRSELALTERDLEKLRSQPPSPPRDASLAHVEQVAALIKKELAALEAGMGTGATVNTNPLPPAPGFFQRLFRKQYTQEEARKIDEACDRVFSRAVEAAYQTTLRRPADEAGLWHWVAWTLSSTDLVSTWQQQQRIIALANQRVQGIERQVTDILNEQFRRSPEYRAKFAKEHQPVVASEPIMSFSQPGKSIEGLGYGFVDPFTGQTPDISPQPAGSGTVLAPTSRGTQMSFGGTLSAVGDGLMQFANSDAFKAMLNAGVGLHLAEQQKDAGKAAQAAQEQSAAISQMLTLVQSNNSGNQNASTIAALQQQLMQTQQFMMAAQAQAANRQPLSIPAPAAVTPASSTPASSTPGWVLPVVIGGVGLLAVGGMMFAMKKRK
jgi:hypothetical protein